MNKYIDIESIKTAEPFKSLFPISPSILSAITESIIHAGYDVSKPIVIWDETDILLDGHTRLEASKQAGFDSIPACRVPFASEDEAFDYAVRQQRDRRNLTDADILRLVAICDQRRKSGERTDLASHDARSSGKSAADTADKVGVSTSKIERARRVIAQADEPTRAAVMAGEKSINAAAKEIAEKKKAIEATPARLSVFNQTNDNIEWAKWSWNPVTGCKFGCDYCYAHDIAMRFNGDFEPTFHPDRMAAPKNTKVPAVNDIGYRNVFVCSMADLFGDWVPDEWINQILDAVRAAPQWNFLFLTKNPKRLINIKWPDNAWVGTTVDRQSRVKPAEEAFKKIKAKVKFLSCEPMLENLSFEDMTVFDWVIIGGRSKNTTGPEFQPDWLWVESLLTQARASGCKVYFKPNLKSRPNEYPEA